MKKLLISMVLAAAMLGQTPAAKSSKQPAKSKPSIDTVIELVQGGMSESLVIKTLQSQGKTYSLSPEDMVKLQKAGVTEPIIIVMTDPKASVVLPTVSTTSAPPSVAAAPPEAAAAMGPSAANSDPAPATAPATDGPVAAVATPFPPPLPNTPPELKRRVVVAPFDNGAIKDLVQSYPQAAYLFGWRGQQSTAQNTDDVGHGIRALLMRRLQQSDLVTVLERNKAIDTAGDEGPSAKTDPKSRPRTGRTLGADCVVTGDITIFGRDNTTDRKGGVLGAWIQRWPKAFLGGFGMTKKEEKAVVAIEFRIVDTETSAVLLTANARGESIRKSKSLGIEGLGITGGGAGGGGFQNLVASSGFEKTILGEATIDAVNKIAKQLEEKIPQLPPKQRNIEGYVAAITPSGLYLDVGANDGVLVGDRFEISRIDNEVINPRTQEVLTVEAVKVGEFVVSELRNEHGALGAYGGQPLSPDYIKVQDKGYQARLISK